MKNYKIASKCCYIASIVFYIAALILFVLGKPILGNVCLCLGSAFLCFNYVIINKYKKSEDKQNEKNNTTSAI